jgi:hypothetical protein
VDILIDLVACPKDVQGIVSTKEPLTVSLRAMQAISVVHIVAANSADFLLFEPVEAPVSLFSYLADSKLSQILACNDSDQLVEIPKGYKLGDLLELDEEHCY